jgi:hypothetical protein
MNERRAKTPPFSFVAGRNFKDCSRFAQRSLDWSSNGRFFKMRNWIVAIIGAVALALTLSATPVEARHGWGHGWGHHGWGGHHGRHLGWYRGHHHGWRHHHRHHRW